MLNFHPKSALISLEFNCWDSDKYLILFSILMADYYECHQDI